MISDENEKLEMKSIDNGMIALYCVMCKRVISEESVSFDITLCLHAASAHLSAVKSSSAPILPSHRSRALVKALQCSLIAITIVNSGHVEPKIPLVVPQKSSQVIKAPDSTR